MRKIMTTSLIVLVLISMLSDQHHALAIELLAFPLGMVLLVFAPLILLGALVGPIAIPLAIWMWVRAKREGRSLRLPGLQSGQPDHAATARMPVGSSVPSTPAAQEGRPAVPGMGGPDPFRNDVDQQPPNAAQWSPPAE